MNDPLFSREMLADYQTKLEKLVRQKQMKNYTIQAENEKERQERYQKVIRGKQL